MIEKQNILSLHYEDIQGLIVDVLKKRPAYSVKKASLATEILRGLEIDIRREARKIFESRVFEVVEMLKEKGIIKEYVSKNVRLKLKDIHEYPLFRMPEGKTPGRQSDETAADLADDEADFDTAAEIPDLPDEVYEDEKEDTETDLTSGGIPFGGIIDPETNRLLEIFLEKDGSDVKEGGRTNISGGKPPDLLQEIKAHYEQDRNIKIVLESDKLLLKVTTTSGHIDLVINFLEETGTVDIKSYIPYLGDARREVGQLFWGSGYKGELSVIGWRDQEFFSIADSMLVSKVSFRDVIERIDRVIFESAQVDKIIDKYL